MKKNKEIKESTYVICDSAWNKMSISDKILWFLLSKFFPEQTLQMRKDYSRLLYSDEISQSRMPLWLNPSPKEILCVDMYVKVPRVSENVEVSFVITPSGNLFIDEKE